MHRFLALCMVIILAGCIHTPPAGKAAVSTFDHISPVPLNVSIVNIEDQYTPPLKLPNIEHTLVNPPYRAAYNMARRTFQNTGANDELSIIIREAEILQTQGDLETSNGFDFWNQNRTEIYKGYLRVELVLKQSVPPYSELGRGDVKVNRTLKLSESTSLTERETSLNQMVEGMMRDFHAGLVRIAEEEFRIVAP